MRYDDILGILQSEKDYAKEHYIPIIRPESAKILYDIVSKYQPSTILEIGTAIGFSGSIMLSTSDSVTLDTIELKEELYDKAKEVFSKTGLADRVCQYLGDAKDVIQSLVDGGKKYDLVFLDGPKAQYIHYLPHLTRLLSVDGVIVADNVLFQGLVESTEPIPKKKKTIVNNLREYLKVVQCPPYETELLHIEDGIAITKVKEI